MLAIIVCHTTDAQSYIVYPDSSVLEINLARGKIALAVPEDSIEFKVDGKQQRVAKSSILFMIDRRATFIATAFGEKSRIANGIFYSVSESRIELITVDKVRQQVHCRKIPIDQIKRMVIKKYDPDGPLIGMAIGFAIGATIGLAQGDTEATFFSAEHTAGENAAIGGFFLALDGALIGKLVSSGRKQFKLDGGIDPNKNPLHLEKWTIKK